MGIPMGHPYSTVLMSDPILNLFSLLRDFSQFLNWLNTCPRTEEDCRNTLELAVHATSVPELIHVGNVRLGRDEDSEDVLGGLQHAFEAFVDHLVEADPIGD